MTSNQGGLLKWFENDGTPIDGGWIEHVIASSKPFYGFALADLDVDNDMDVVVDTHFNTTLAWYENDGTPIDGGWGYHSIISWCDECNSVTAVDINKDNYPDILVTATDANLKDEETLYLIINDGTPTDGGWTRQILEDDWYLYKADAGDIDGDGDIDVVGALSGSIRWWENNGGTGSTWPDWLVGGSFGSPSAIQLVDLDRDNDLDVLGSSYSADEITWFENNGSPTGGEWPRHVIDNTYQDPKFSGAADIDGDEDWDVFGATESGTFWWEQTHNYLIFLPLVMRQ
jgi:hypothetical protein